MAVERVKIGHDNPNMNFETPDGRRFPTRGGVAEMPRPDAERFLGAGIPGLERFRGTVMATGWGEGTCDSALKQAQRRQEG